MLRSESVAPRLSNRFGPKTLLVMVVAFGAITTSSTVWAHKGCQLPETISLPDGWQPEGVAAGPRGTIYAGSISTGAVYQAWVRNGNGRVVAPPHEGRSAIGIAWDRRTDLLYVAGGPTGQVFVYDGDTGADVAAISVDTGEGSFINDTIVTREAVYFTDSYKPFVYKLPLAPSGELPDAPALESIALIGDFDFAEGEFNANGIEATPNGSRLIIVNSYFGTLYSVASDTGEAELIDLNGAEMTNGDGLLLVGDRLYVVQNFLNQVAVVKLGLLAPEGTVVDVLENDAFDIPTTAAQLGGSLYVVNSRFNIEPTPETTYEIVRVPLR